MIDKWIKQISRGKKAELALQNEAVAEGFEEVEAGIVNAWKACDPFDEKLQTLLKMKLEALKGVKDEMAHRIIKGKAAQQSMEQHKQEK